MLTQRQLDSLRKGAELGKGTELSDLYGVPVGELRTTIVQSSKVILKLVEEVEKLHRGLQAARGPLEEIKRVGAESEKDPSLSWYEDDRHHDKKVEFGSEAEDILDAIEKALDS